MKHEKSSRLIEWPTQADSLNHEGDIVTVFNAKTGEPILTGKFVSHTDLLGGAGILEPDPIRGFDYVKAAIRFPENPVEYRTFIANYRFRIDQRCSLQDK